MSQDIWSILGIVPTKDKKTIKKAYAQKGKECHPEEHPEAFQELQQAYKKALAYASSNKDVFIQTKTYQSQPTHKDNSQDSKSSSKDYQIHVPIEELDSVSQSQTYSFDVDFDELETQTVFKKSRELFNEEDLEDFQDNQEYQNYVFETFTKQMGKTINEEKMQLFIENTNLLIQCHDQDFCLKVDNYLSHCRFRFKRQRYAYWAQNMKKLNFLKTSRQLEKLKKKKDSLPIGFYVVVMMFIASGFLFGEDTKKKQTPKYTPVVDKSKLQIVNTQAQTTKMDYYANRPYINGVTLEEDSGEYTLKDKNGKVIENQISHVYFTDSEVMLYQKEVFVYLNTKTMKKMERTYKDIKVVSVEKDGEKESQKMIVASYDGYYWKLYNLDGDAIMKIEEKREKKDISKIIYIRNNKAYFE